MKTFFAILAFVTAGAANGATYTMTPTPESEQLCKKLGYAGEFRLKQVDSKSWLVSFASGEERYLGRKAKGVFYSIASCTVGCMGYAETRLNLNTGEFYDWNSVNRKPEVCKGSVSRSQ